VQGSVGMGARVLVMGAFTVLGGLVLGLVRARRQLEKGGRSAQESRFENEDLDFHRRVRQGYLDLARREPERFRRIDAAQDENRVREDIRVAVESFLRLHTSPDLGTMP